MIKIVDYGVGNIQAFSNLFKRLGIPAERARTKEDLSNATKLVLPGVGHFDHAMTKLNKSGMRESLDNKVLHHKTPIIGICVGMQMLATGSEEGQLEGLNWIPGKVKAFKNINHLDLPLPHMGWNTVNPESKSKLFKNGFENSAEFYFLHSFYFDADEKKDVSARASYGIEFEAVVSRENIHGVQCHPEKSHHWGASLIRNFSLIDSC
tara:strand:- start:28 stop:651 length:624 start_codon:yes stop_codon:yes gene_type:complete